MALSYLPGASLVPRKLSDGSFPVSLVPPKLSNESFPASLVPFRLSKWPFPASLSKAILCSERLFKGQSVLRAASRGAHPRICREPGRSPLKLY